MSVPLERIAPGPPLHHFAGEARGFWARADRWVVHGGVVHEVRVDAEAQSRGEGPSHVAAVQAAADAAWGNQNSEGTSPKLRLYGGFAFRSDHEAADTWAGFPAARFQVPQIEVRAKSDGTGTLILRASVKGEDPTIRVELSEEAQRLAELFQSRTDEETAARGVEGGSGRVIAREESERARWGEVVQDALDAIGSGQVSKVVLARTMDLALDQAIDPARVALALWRRSTGSHVFLFEPEPGRSFLGAAPETISTLHGGSLLATAVAGSTRSGRDEEERLRLAEALLASEKDRAEQRVVTDEMVRRLEPLVDYVEVEPEPHVLALRGIQHLETVIRAEVPPGRHVLDVVGALHPTPAVCGYPRDAARQLLLTEEHFERGWYAGPLGWFTPSGEGVFVPALRSAVVTGNRWRLFAGAGIVGGSDAASEWEETGIKFEPVLQALSAAGVET